MRIINKIILIYYQNPFLLYYNMIYYNMSENSEQEIIDNLVDYINSKDDKKEFAEMLIGILVFLFELDSDTDDSDSEIFTDDEEQERIESETIAYLENCDDDNIIYAYPYPVPSDHH